MLFCPKEEGKNMRVLEESFSPIDPGVILKKGGRVFEVRC
jgi:hypothetical protein